MLGRRRKEVREAPSSTAKRTKSTNRLKFTKRVANTRRVESRLAHMFENNELNAIDHKTNQEVLSGSYKRREMIEIGQLIREFRKLSNISASVAASKLGISEDTLRDLEVGQLPVNSATDAIILRVRTWFRSYT